LTETDDFELKAEKRPEAADGDLARKEQALFSKKLIPNTIHIPLWKSGYLAFNPDNHVPIFALMALIVLSALAVVMAVVGIWVAVDAVWMDRIFTALGHAITAIVGAMVGAAITTKKSE
jgi:roadblock/LC7 domain-containing protein